MFDAVARRYDLANDVLSFGLDRHWRNVTTSVLGLLPGHRVLDLAAGTGTSSRPLTARGADVVACDFSLGMLRVGHQRTPDVCFVAGDALRLPFADGTFDAVTISFGLRNVEDPSTALLEMRRVVRPGGRLVVCEFARPSRTVLRSVYDGVVLRAVPAVARLVSSDFSAYHYLAESIRRWPAQRELAALIAGAGWGDVAWRDVTGGIVAVHRATAGNRRAAPSPADT